MPSEELDRLLTPASVESIIESVRLSYRRPGIGCHTREYKISWTEPDGQPAYTVQLMCPVCDEPMKWMDFFGHPTRSPGQPPTSRPLLAAWIPQDRVDQSSVAVAYILLIPSGTGLNGDGSVAFTVAGRIGIRSQWRDFSAGNIPQEGKSWLNYTERFYAPEGPGIYPVPVHDE